METISISMPFKWIECDVRGWRLETREGATFATVSVPKPGGGEEEKAFLFGGLSRDLHGTISTLTYNPDKESYACSIVSEGDADKKRYGHTCTLYEKSLIIIGGARMYNKESKCRECRSDVFFYNTLTNKWAGISPAGASFEARRYHSAAIVGKHVLVYGGVNIKNTYLSDLMVLIVGALPDKRGEYRTFYRWSGILTRGEKPGPLANHSCQLVLHPERYKTPGLITITSLPDMWTASKTRVESL